MCVWALPNKLWTVVNTPYTTLHLHLCTCHTSFSCNYLTRQFSIVLPLVVSHSPILYSVISHSPHQDHVLAFMVIGQHELLPSHLPFYIMFHSHTLLVGFSFFPFLCTLSTSVCCVIIIYLFLWLQEVPFQVFVITTISTQKLMVKTVLNLPHKFRSAIEDPHCLVVTDYHVKDSRYTCIMWASDISLYQSGVTLTVSRTLGNWLPNKKGCTRKTQWTAGSSSQRPVRQAHPHTPHTCLVYPTQHYLGKESGYARLPAPIPT